MLLSRTMDELHIPGFEVLGVVHKTSVSVTFKAKQQSLDRVVELRVLRPEVADDARAREGFVAIAKATARLKHTNIAQVYDVGVADDLPPYTITEHVDGPTLSELIKADGTVPPKRCAQIALSVASGLAYAWENARLVHRNIKPEEIRLDADGTTKIVDFARATLVDHPEYVAHEADMIVGTPNYISPEQAQGSNEIDCRSDMYALGATLYQMATGRIPFADFDPLEILDKQISATLPHPKSLVPSLPGGFCMLIRRMMMKLPSDRPETWQDVLADIQRVCDGRPPLRRKSAPVGSSTVEAYAPAGVKQRAGGKKSASRSTGKRKRRVHPIFWLAAFAWLGWLGWWRWNNPEAPLPYILAQWMASPAKPSANTPPEPSSPQVTTPTQQPPLNPLPPDSTPGGSSVTTVTQTEPQGNGAEPSPIQTPTVSSAVRVALRNALGREDYEAAVLELRRDGSQSALAAATQLQRLPALAVIVISDALMQSRDQPLTLKHRGVQRVIVPKFIVNGRLHAGFISSAGERRIEIGLADLDASERLRLLPTPTNADAYALRCVLAIAAGNASEQKAAAPKSGALAPYLLLEN